MNNMSKNWKSAIFYILIPILLVALALGFANRQNQTDLKYSQVVHLFKTDQVKSFEIDLTSGSLTYSTFEEPDKVQKYNVPSVPQPKSSTLTPGFMYFSSVSIQSCVV